MGGQWGGGELTGSWFAFILTPSLFKSAIDLLFVIFLNQCYLIPSNSGVTAHTKPDCRSIIAGAPPLTNASKQSKSWGRFMVSYSRERMPNGDSSFDKSMFIVVFLRVGHRWTAGAFCHLRQKVALIGRNFIRCRYPYSIYDR